MSSFNFRYNFFLEKKKFHIQLLLRMRLSLRPCSMSITIKDMAFSHLFFAWFLEHQRANHISTNHHPTWIHQFFRGMTESIPPPRTDRTKVPTRLGTVRIYCHIMRHNATTQHWTVLLYSYNDSIEVILQV